MSQYTQLLERQCNSSYIAFNRNGLNNLDSIQTFSLDLTFSSFSSK